MLTDRLSLVILISYYTVDSQHDYIHVYRFMDKTMCWVFEKINDQTLRAKCCQEYWKIEYSMHGQKSQLICYFTLNMCGNDKPPFKI